MPVAALALFSLAACGGGEGKQATAPKRKFVLQREWTANSEFAGDLLAREFAEDSAVDLDVRPGSSTSDPRAEVASGSAHLAVAAADRVLAAISRGEPLLIVGAATYQSPVIFVAARRLGLRQPSDLKGRRVGIQTGTATENSLKFLLDANEIDPASVKNVDSGWTGVESLLAGEIDVLGVFAYDEPVRLEKEGFEFDTLDPARFGVQTVGTVYFTSRTVAETRKEDLALVIRSLQRGWLQAKRNPELAIRALAALDAQVDTVKESASLRRGFPYFLGEGEVPLYARPDRWDRTASAMQASGLVPQIDIGRAVDQSFLMRSGDAGLAP
jgi:NitT/TauT family transport system substrate-binding protein